MSEQELQEAISKITRRSRWLGCLDHIWAILEDPESSTFAYWCSWMMPVFLMMTVFVTLAQTLEPPPLHGLIAAVLETTIDFLFFLEFLLRFAACPNRSIFFLNFYNLVDLAASAPLFIRAIVGFNLPDSIVVSNIPQTILLFCVPIIRLLKTLRRFEKFHLLLKAFELAFEALPVLLFMLFLISLFFSELIFLVEPRDNIPSLPTASWLTIVTMTTVGYGDVIPTSAAGSVVTGVLVVITVLYMAVPLGIIGNAFTQTWNDRDRILLMHRTRARLLQWGYSAAHIPILFTIDGKSDGCLDMHQFRALLHKMNLGFNDERIYQLFKSFDTDGDGFIDDHEFVRTLFPNHYEALYSQDDNAHLCITKQKATNENSGYTDFPSVGNYSVNIVAPQ